MNYQQLIESRHSCRHFSRTPIEQEKMDRIYEAIRLAPTAGNLQSYIVREVRDKTTKFNLYSFSGGQAFVNDADVVLVFLATPEVSAKKYGDRGVNLYSVQDATIACTYAHLAAHDLGLGSCWVGAFEEGKVAKAVWADWPWKPVAMLAIGHPLSKTLTSPNKSDKVQVYDSSSNNWCSR